MRAHLPIAFALGLLAGLSGAYAQDAEPAPTTLEPRPSGPAGDRYVYGESSDDAVSPSSDEEAAYSITTSTRSASPAFSSDRATNVVTQEDLTRRQPESVTDALDEEPGVMIQSTNRGAGTLFLRGQVGAENLIYLDGVRFNQSTFRTGPIQYLNTIDPWAVGKIEIVRGPGSVLYGSDALGGVVQLFPRARLREPGSMADARFQFRSADSTYGVGLDAAARTEDGLGARLGGSFKLHDDLRAGSRGGESIVASSQQDTTLAGSGFDEFHFRGGLDYALDSRNELRIDYLGSSIDDAPRFDRVGSGEVRHYDNRDDLVWLTFEHDGEAVFDSVAVKVAAHRTREDVRRFNCATRDDDGVSVARDPVSCARQPGLDAERRRLNEDETLTVGTSVAVSSLITPWRARVNWGAELYHDRVLASSRTDFAAPAFEPNVRDRGNFQQDSTTTNFGVYALAEQSPWVTELNEIVLRAGLRLDSIQSFAPDVTPELGDVEYDHFGIVGSAGISWYYSSLSNLYLNWSQGFRSPNLQETTVLGDTGNFFEVPNADLGPERSDTFELGSKLNIKNFVRTSASVWASLLSDRITREGTELDGQAEIDGKPVQRRVNRDSAYYYGADLEVRSYPIWDFSAYGSVSYIDGAVEADDEDTFDAGPFHDLLGGSDKSWENPRRLPPIFYTAGLTYSPSSTFYSTIYVKGAAAQDKLAPGDLQDLRICEVRPGVLAGDVGESCDGGGAWTTLNLRGGVRYGAARADLSFENLTDLRYRYHGSGFLAPGFNAMLTLTVSH